MEYSWKPGDPDDDLTTLDGPLAKRVEYIAMPVMLKYGGWTRTTVKKLLGEPDSFGRSRNGMTHLYDLARVQAAEAEHPEIVERGVQRRAKLNTERDAAVAKAMDEGHAVWRKTVNGWVLVGKGLKSGTQVKVVKKSGERQTVWVGAVVAATDDGLVHAKKGREPGTSKPEAPYGRDSIGRPLKWNGQCKGDPCVCGGMERWQECDTPWSHGWERAYRH